MGTESGKGLRIFTAGVAPTVIEAEDIGSGGAGEVAEGAGLADIAEDALGAGDGRGAGDELFVEDDLDRFGFGAELRISSTRCDNNCDGTLSLTIFVGRSSGCGIGSCGRGRFGGLIAPAPIPAPFRDIRTGWTIGLGSGEGRILAGSGTTSKGLGGLVRNLFEDFLKVKRP